MFSMLPWSYDVKNKILQSKKYIYFIFLFQIFKCKHSKEEFEMLVEFIPALKNRLTLVNSSISRDSVIDDGMLVKLERKHNYVP